MQPLQHNHHKILYFDFHEISRLCPVFLLDFSLYIEISSSIFIFIDINMYLSIILLDIKLIEWYQWIESNYHLRYVTPTFSPLNYTGIFSFPNELPLVNQYVKKLLWARRESNPHLHWLKASCKTNNLLQTQIFFNMSSGATGIRTLNSSVQARCVPNYIHSPNNFNWILGTELHRLPF